MKYKTKMVICKNKFYTATLILYTVMSNISYKGWTNILKEVKTLKAIPV